MNGQAELAAFQRSRRTQLKPGDTGLTSYGERREELAGVSMGYYVRFEQVRSYNVSDVVAMIFPELSQA